MDTNSLNLIKKYKEKYYPVLSYDVLETVIYNFVEEINYTDPSYVMELTDILLENIYEVSVINKI